MIYAQKSVKKNKQKTKNMRSRTIRISLKSHLIVTMLLAIEIITRRVTLLLIYAQKSVQKKKHQACDMCSEIRQKEEAKDQEYEIQVYKNFTKESSNCDYATAYISHY